MQTVIWQENCRKYWRDFVKYPGNYGNIYVKWVNSELHIVIWRKKTSHIHCWNCWRDFAAHCETTTSGMKISKIMALFTSNDWIQNCKSWFDGKNHRTSIAGNAGGILLPFLRPTSRRENKGNYGDISVKWLNPELHIVIWRKKHLLPEMLLGVLLSWMWTTSLRENKGKL